MFLVQGEGRTMAELGMAIKNRISHRARAVQAARSYLATL
ncbi:MAG: non-canonical purine NTP pyrophosphatase [Anaerolineales bacterium]